jgi:arsenate reductase
MSIKSGEPRGADMKSEKVIFICSFNSVRSPIAEGFLSWKGVGRYTVCSAGIAPIRVHPCAARVMQELTIDISGHIPASIYQYRNQDFDYVVTLCDDVRTTAEEVLPGGNRFLHRNFVSPLEIGKSSGEILADYQKLRDEIALWLDEIFPDATLTPGKSNDDKKLDRNDPRPETGIS